MFKQALLLAIATTVMAGCAAPAGSSFVASNGAAVSADAKAVTAAEQRKADSVLDQAYPAFQYPTRTPFHSVGIPSSAYSPVSKAEAGLKDLQLAHTPKADELSFRGVARTQGERTAAKFLVSGTLNLKTGTLSGVSISFLP